MKCKKMTSQPSVLSQRQQKNPDLYYCYSNLPLNLATCNKSKNSPFCCMFTPGPGLFTFQGVVGDDEFRVAVFGTFIITNLVYWTVGSIYSYFDISGTPEFLRKYKVCTKVDVDKVALRQIKNKNKMAAKRVRHHCRSVSLPRGHQVKI